MSVDFSRFKALTFDCYGTLVDWERGILDAFHAMALRHEASCPHDEELLRRFAEAESRIQAGPYRTYRGVLEEVARELGHAVGFAPNREEAAAFAATVPRWPVFPDTVAGLEALSRRYRLGVVSNVDDDLFAGSAAQLQVALDVVVTAQQVRGYKPAPGHFHEALRRLDLPLEQVLHVAQSPFHDIAPATALGFTCVWVNRRAGKEGGGATAPATATAHLEVPDLATLARLAAQPAL